MVIDYADRYVICQYAHQERHWVKFIISNGVQKGVGVIPPGPLKGRGE